MHTHTLLGLGMVCLALNTSAQILIQFPEAEPDGGVVHEELLEDMFPLDCGNDSTGKIPLNDLGTETYEGFTGGLFKEGNNDAPDIHLDKGIKISNNLKRRNDTGAIDNENGTIMMIGMGASTASDAFNTYRSSMIDADWEGVNPCLDVRSVFIGGKDLGDILDPEENYWDKFQDRLEEKEIDPDQVQIVWMMHQSEATTNNLETYLTYVTGQYKLLLADMLIQMPNLRQVFISGMHYTGYTDPAHERYDAMVEPKGYWGNLAIRELINMQIDGDPDLDFEGADRKVPYITWGPYFWADGSNERSDGLTWTCDEFRSDPTGGGFHLKEEFQYKESDMLRTFLETDPVASIWYNDGPKWETCGTGRYAESTPEEPLTITATPNPFTQQFTLQIPASMTGATALQIIDLNGRVIHSELPNAELRSVITIDASHIPDGIYMVILQNGNERHTAKIIKQS